MFASNPRPTNPSWNWSSQFDTKADKRSGWSISSSCHVILILIDQYDIGPVIFIKHKIMKIRFILVSRQQMPELVWWTLDGTSVVINIAISQTVGGVNGFVSRPVCVYVPVVWDYVHVSMCGWWNPPPPPQSFNTHNWWANRSCLFLLMLN